MEWDESFSVGVKEIDDQHKKLLDALNKLTGAMNQEEGNKVIGEVLDELAKYTVYHFKTEEKYFDKFHYELTEEHKKQHKDFVEKVSLFINDFKKGKALLSFEILTFLTDWVENHIKGADKKYTKCFNEHGLR